MKQFTILVFAVVTLLSCQEKKIENTHNNITGDYFGEKPPEATPEIFAPGVFSTGLYERDFTISPDGKEIYYTIMGVNYSVIAVSKQIGGAWTNPKVASFSGSTEFYDAEPHISPDGKKFLFLSTRPQEGQEPKAGWAYQDIWAMDKTEDGWGEPYNLGKPINTDLGEYFPSVTKDGTLYFTRAEEDEEHQAIFRSEWINGKYSEPVKLPKQINATGYEYNASISPNDKYLILCNQPNEGKIGVSDYSVSFRDQEGNWSELINLGSPINKSGCRAISPYISPDGKYLFFSSNFQNPLGDTINHSITIEQLQDTRTKPKNGNSDIYWVKSSVIDALKPL